MIMDEKCPYCGSDDYEPIDWDDDCDCCELDSRRDYVCNSCGEEFIVSKEYRLYSCIVAKDDNELDELLKKEKKE